MTDNSEFMISIENMAAENARLRTENTMLKNQILELEADVKQLEQANYELICDLEYALEVERLNS